MSTSQSWELARLRRESAKFRLENAQLSAELLTVRESTVPQVDQVDSPDIMVAYCGLCSEPLDELEDARFMNFCPYCGAHLEWGDADA